MKHLRALTPDACACTLKHGHAAGCLTRVLEVKHAVRMAHCWRCDAISMTGLPLQSSTKPDTPVVDGLSDDANAVVLYCCGAVPTVLVLMLGSKALQTRTLCPFFLCGAGQEKPTQKRWEVEFTLAEAFVSRCWSSSSFQYANLFF